MAGCNTGRNVQKYKGGGASTLQDALENGNTASLNINLSSPAVFVGDGGGLSNINASSTTGNLQAVTDNGATTTNKITFSNGITSLQTSGNALVTGNVTASFYRGDGGTLSNIAASKNFQEVTDLGATSSHKITLTNGVTSLQTSGNVSVTGNVTASEFYGDGKTLTGVALSADLASNSTRIGTVSTDLTSNASRIGVVETDLASNSTRIGTVSTDLASNASRIGVVETDLASNSTRIGTVSTDLASNASRIGVVETDLASNSADLTSNASRISVLETDLASNSTRIGTVSTDLASNSTRVGTVSTDLASNSTRIGTVSTDLASNSTRIGTVSTDLASNSTRIGTVSTDLASNSSRIGTVSTDLASNSTRIGTVSTDLTSNASRINTLESEVQPVNRGGTGISSSYTVGQILVASDTAVFTPLTPGTSGHFLKSQGSGNSLIWASVAEVGSATPGSLFTGNYLTGANNDGSDGGGHTGESHTTIAADATTTNTASKLVARDGSGDIFIQNLYTDGSIGLGKDGSGTRDTIISRSGVGAVTINGTVNAITLNGNVVASNVVSTDIYGTIKGSNTVTAITLNGNVVASNIVSTDIYGTIQGSNTISSTIVNAITLKANVVASNVVSTDIYGTIQGSNTISSTTVNAITLNANVVASNVVSTDIYGTIQGSNTISSTTVNAITLKANVVASNIVTNDGSGINQLNASNVNTGTLLIGRGGTGVSTAYTKGDILYGPSSGTALSILSPADSNADVGKFLKLGTDDTPEWASVSTTGVVTSDVTIEDTDHALTFVSTDTTDAQTLKKEYGTLKYKPSSGTLTTSNIVTSDTSIHARNGIANTTPIHTLDIGSNVSVIDDGIDKLFIRGNCYVINDIISLGTVYADTLQVKDAFIKRTTVVAERPTRQVRLN